MIGFWKQFGVTSFGMRGCDAFAPAAYGNVGYHADWIKSITGTLNKGLPKCIWQVMLTDILDIYLATIRAPTSLSLYAQKNSLPSS